MHFDLDSVLKLKGFDNGGRQTNGETVAPFGDPHGVLQ
jgi:hypothetical protein